MNRRLQAITAIVAITLGAASLTACGSSAATEGAGTSTSVSTTSVQRVDPEGFQQAIDSGATIVDVRTPQEFAAGHIDGAVNIDVEGPGFAEQVSKLDPNATYAVYCRSGNRSRTATAVMTQEGLTRVVELDGGIVSWQSEGQPVS